MDLLRIQDNVTCQAVVQVREKSTRAYVVKRQILERKSGESYKSYNPATNKLANGLDNVPEHNGALPNSLPLPVIPFPPPPPCPSSFNELSAEQSLVAVLPFSLNLL
jgi:hypothetical protein